MWLFFAISGYLLSVVVSITDKLILSKVDLKPAVFVFYSTIFVLPLAFLLPFDVSYPQGILPWTGAILSGVTFVLGLWTMYLAVKQSEISHIGPLIGAVIPVFIFFFARIILGENLSASQMAGAGIIIIGSLLIAAENSPDHNGFHKGLIWGVVASVFFAVSSVLAKYIYGLYGFYSGFILTKFPIGLMGLLMLVFLPEVRKNLVVKKDGAALKDCAGQLVLVGVNKFLGVAGLILVQYAVALGSVTLVYALAGIQYAALVICVFLLSRFLPRTFKEEYSRWELAQESLAVLIICAGLAIIVF